MSLAVAEQPRSDEGAKWVRSHSPRRAQQAQYSSGVVGCVAVCGGECEP